MGTIPKLFKLDFSALVIGIFYFLSAIIVMAAIVGRFSELVSRPARWLEERQEGHNLLIQTAKNLDTLQQKHGEDAHQSVRRGDTIREDLKKLADMFIGKEINNLCWEIIKFFTTIAEGRPYNKGGYKHCIHTYERYGEPLADNDVENGETELFMELIQGFYKGKLKNGF